MKPISKTFTDSLSELGNLKLEHLPGNYKGSALTLIESLSSLLILGNNTEFERAVLWLSDNLIFDVDARVNLFECNIRVLGGLVSAHILATDSSSKLPDGIYNNQLLNIAEDLGRRFLLAFDTPSGVPYAWINLKVRVFCTCFLYCRISYYFYFNNCRLFFTSFKCKVVFIHKNVVKIRLFVNQLPF